MALTLNALPSLQYPSCSTPMTAIATPVSPIFSLQYKFIPVQPKSFSGVRRLVPFHYNLKERCGFITTKATDMDEVGPNNEGGSSKSDEEALPVDKLPLESKLQLNLEHKMKIKLAKKIRLRRKRLVRKRRMRKKGRWPPSKVKKNKNV